MSNQLAQCKELKQGLKNFVLDADGALATALESKSAEYLRQWSEKRLNGVDCSDLAIDMFTTEGRVNGQSVLDLFIQGQPNLSEADCDLVKNWKATFNGLFVVTQATSGTYEVMNWLTQKHYRVYANWLQPEAQLSRLEPDEIIIARLSPITDGDWIFSGPLLLLGKLGKPKLAVAIGNFRSWFPNHLYGDAPELLEEAWASVKRYHDSFIQFFESDQITLSGYELNKKLKAYQEFATQRHLEDAGIDGSQSLKDVINQAGVSEEEISESVEALGEDSRQVSRLIDSSKEIRMMMPSINLPDEFRKAEAVTVFVHPRWGQTFLKDYVQMSQLLDATDDSSIAKLDRLLQRYLKDETVNPYVWRCFAEEHSTRLEIALRRVLEQPAFSIASDLDPVLCQFDKPLEPVLPEIASVPVHLHNLFQDALKEVNKTSSKKKNKGKKKRKKTGFV